MTAAGRGAESWGGKGDEHTINPVCLEHISEGCTSSEARKLELWSQVNRPESTGAEKQLCGPSIHSLGLGLQSLVAGFLGVIFDFHGFVRFGKENKCRTRLGLLLAVAGQLLTAPWHLAEFPGLLRAVGSREVRKRPHSRPVGH